MNLIIIQLKFILLYCIKILNIFKNKKEYGILSFNPYIYLAKVLYYIIHA